MKHASVKNLLPNQKYKDSLFRFIFGREENKEYLLSLYNAVNGTKYTDKNSLKITTIEDSLFVSYKNDLSFIFDSCINLYEHQSTINYNMPLRGMIYSAVLYSSYITDNGLDLYRKKMIKIPNPRYIVFYNGTDNAPEKQYLQLSDAFCKDDNKTVYKGMYEWTAIVYNVNAGHSKALMESCKALKDYSEFIESVRTYKESFNSLKDAIEAALKDAIEKNLLNGFFSRCKSEVLSMALLEFNEELHEKSLREEGFEEGLQEGKIASLVELVADGIITKEIGAKKSGLTMQAFETLMAKNK